nr:MAG TPA: hypothetical protein [Caudoviricetes sp.]
MGLTPPLEKTASGASALLAGVPDNPAIFGPARCRAACGREFGRVIQANLRFCGAAAPDCYPASSS